MRPLGPWRRPVRPISGVGEGMSKMKKASGTGRQGGAGIPGRWRARLTPRVTQSVCAAIVTEPGPAQKPFNIRSTRSAP
jgi:hypothetical protein